MIRTAPPQCIRPRRWWIAGRCSPRGRLCRVPRACCCPRHVGGMLRARIKGARRVFWRQARAHHSQPNARGPFWEARRCPWPAAVWSRRVWGSRWAWWGARWAQGRARCRALLLHGIPAHERREGRHPTRAFQGRGAVTRASGGCRARDVRTRQGRRARWVRSGGRPVFVAWTRALPHLGLDVEGAAVVAVGDFKEVFEAGFDLVGGCGVLEAQHLPCFLPVSPAQGCPQHASQRRRAATRAGAFRGPEYGVGGGGRGGGGGG